MPLHTSITRDGETLSLRWSDFHVAAMAVAAACDDPSHPEAKLFQTSADRPDFAWPADQAEAGTNCPAEWLGKDQSSYPEVPCPITGRDAFTIASYPYLAMTPLNSGPYTLKREHKFVDTTDGEILHFLPGDVLSAARH
jgi:hypothetical protein